MGKTNPSQTQLEFKRLLEREIWPSQERFPLNIGTSKVENEVMKDLHASEQYTIITGFTSLSHLVDTFGNQTFERLKKVRIVLGFEPMLKGRKQYETDIKLSKEIKDYWLRQGFSITLGGAVLRLIELIDQGFIDFRFADRLHAKIYVGDHHAILGSSNFSKSGLSIQHEANIRVAESEEAVEDVETQYKSIKKIADNFYNQAAPFNDEIVALLKELIQQVTWQEALARAIAEVVEGHWLVEYIELYKRLEQSKLWPTQWRGIAQAMNILQNQSNVLIADPTGSGKTKLCSSLVLTLIHWLWENGKRDQSNSLIVCPPLVIPIWQHEFKNLTFINHNQISMGLLSKGKERRVKQAQDEIGMANILTIDEAHNYIRPDSNRSKAVQSNQANHIILATATPINKRAEDLLQLIQLLDVDNLSDEDFQLYKRLREQPKRQLESGDLDNLKRFISQFTVRRTKSKLNKEVSKEPHKYHNRLGKPCKFPLQHCRTYSTKETEEDKHIVREISNIIKKLKGLTHLRNFNKPEYELKGEDAERTFVERQLVAAKALAGYMIRATLRSSHVALVEHLAGSDYAMDWFKFKSKKNKTGNTIDKLEKYKSKLPNTHTFNKAVFPAWLTDEKEYAQACDEELAHYRKILSLAKKLSGEREIGKVTHLAQLYAKHRLVLTFDSTVISLDYLRSIFESKYPDIEVYVVTGADTGETMKDKVIEMCSLGSTAKGVIMCSDKMSEGVNLQQASTITLLDMPSVLRIAEQRIGRIDRMDSPHEEIEAWWPDDSEEYSLKSDRRLINTSYLAEAIYGSNLQIPKVLRERHFQRTDDINSIIQEYQELTQEDTQWEGIHDSFKPVIELKEGENSVIDETIYEQIKEVQAIIKTRVSFVTSERSWVFFALRGSKHQSPRWYFIDHERKFHTEFPAICEQLRMHLVGKLLRVEWNQSELDAFIHEMREHEIQLLPNKRKRALEVARTILEKKIKKEKNVGMRTKMNEVLRMFQHSSTDFIVDYYKFAEQWMQRLQPYLDEKRKGVKRNRKVYNLKSLLRDYSKIELNYEDLESIIQNCPFTEKIDNRIVACIIGVGGVSNN